MLTVSRRALWARSMAPIERRHSLRRGVSWVGQVVAFCAILGIVWLILEPAGSAAGWAARRLEIVMTLAGLALWRWSWWTIQLSRAVVYRFVVYRRLRRKALAAEAARGPVPQVSVLVATYKEKPWITKAVFESVFSELGRLPRQMRPPTVVAVTGCDTDDREIRKAYEHIHRKLAQGAGRSARPELVLIRNDVAKRPALAAGLRELARRGLDPDGAVILMDGDTIPQPGLLRKVLPLFRLSPPVDAVTTNEDCLIQGPSWFAEWFSLRMAQRHRTMCSISLSERLLCLTGRLSVVRGSVASDPGFIAQVAHDSVEHWLWGRIGMFSGDDKSTMYWLARNGSRMLYVPDAMATTIDVVPSAPLWRSFANIKRWSGNSIRNNGRLLRLGPRKLGLFPWWCVLDQRLSVWTTMVGPVALALSIQSSRYGLAAGYLLWLLVTRTAHAAVGWVHGRRFSACYIPLQILSDWVQSAVKIWVSLHPAKQAWFNRGNRRHDPTARQRFVILRRSFAHYLLAFYTFLFVLAVGMLIGWLPLLRDASLFLGGRTPAPAYSHPCPDCPAGKPHPQPLTTEVESKVAADPAWRIARWERTEPIGRES